MCEKCESLGVDSVDSQVQADKVGVSPIEILAKNTRDMSDSLDVPGGKDAWMEDQIRFLHSRLPGLAEMVGEMTDASVAAEQIAQAFGINPGFSGKIGLNLVLVRTVIESLEAAAPQKA